ncbi:MAG: hypothetical protein ACJAW1_001929 [Glaciecola sp.]|jgi:hypothetical protein
MCLHYSTGVDFVELIVIELTTEKRLAFVAHSVHFCRHY